MRSGKNSSTGPGESNISRSLRGAVVAIAALFPFVIWPGIDRPFSTPKIYFLAGIDVVGAGLAISSGHFHWPALPRGFQFSLVLWAGALGASALFGEFVSPEALALSLCSLAWFVLLTGIRPKPQYLAVAIVVACAGVSAIALFQYAGLDPFRFLGGWTTSAYGSPRMRVFGTLGNPNFVAAFLVGALPLAIALKTYFKKRAFFVAAVVLPTAALFATRSRGGIMAAAALLIWLAVVRRFRGWPPMLAAALILIGLLALIPARAVSTTLAGRLYIWRVSASHLLERPIFGWGPGAFEAKFIEWETGYWRDGKGSEDEREFTGLQAHAHNDYLEILVDRGLVGLLSWLALIASSLVFAFWRNKKVTSRLTAAASAGLFALATVSFVDFPLQRPTELFLVWTLMGLLYLERECCISSEVSKARPTGLWRVRPQ